MKHALSVAALCCGLAGIPAARAGEHFCGRPTPHPIDLAFAAATERSGGVTADVRDAQSAAWEAWDQELNRVYAALVAATAPEARTVLRAAQRAWLAFDEAQARWDAALRADQGTSAAIEVGGAALARRRARVCELAADLEQRRDEP